MPAFSGLLTPNLIDGLIILVTILFIIIGLTQGFLTGIAHSVTYFVSGLFAFKYSPYVSNFLTLNTSISQNVSLGIGFFLIALLSQLFLNKIIAASSHATSDYFQDFKKHTLYKILAPINYLTGPLPSLAQGVLFSAFMLCLIFLFAGSRNVKFFVLESRFGSNLIYQARDLENFASQFLFPSPDPRVIGANIDSLISEKIKRIPHPELLTEFDYSLEDKVREKLNKLRKESGVSEVILDDKLSAEARKHADKMMARGYLSHYDNEGNNLEDRLRQASIRFQNIKEIVLFVPASDSPIFDEITATDSAQLAEVKQTFLSDDFLKRGIGYIRGKQSYDQIYVFLFANPPIAESETIQSQ